MTAIAHNPLQTSQKYIILHEVLRDTDCSGSDSALWMRHIEKRRSHVGDSDI